jgi:hypothetical protein
MSHTQLHEDDFYTWANEQASLLRAGRLSKADIENIATEIESMGNGEKRELISRLEVVLVHLLKWQFQPGLRGKSWSAAIRVQRNALHRHIKDDHGLKGRINEAVTDAYALIQAEAETGLPGAVFPASCPWSFDQVMDAGFWPEAG